MGRPQNEGRWGAEAEPEGVTGRGWGSGKLVNGGPCAPGRGKGHPAKAGGAGTEAGGRRGLGGAGEQGRRELLLDSTGSPVGNLSTGQTPDRGGARVPPRGGGGSLEHRGSRSGGRRRGPGGRGDGEPGGGGSVGRARSGRRGEGRERGRTGASAARERGTPADGPSAEGPTGAPHTLIQVGLAKPTGRSHRPHPPPFSPTHTPSPCHAQ